MVVPGVKIARTDTGRRKAAHQVRAHLEMIQHAQILAAPAGHVASLQMQQADHVGNQFVVIARVDAGANEIHVAAEAGDILR